MLVVKGVMLKEPQDWVLRLTRLSVGEQGLLAAAEWRDISEPHSNRTLKMQQNRKTGRLWTQKYIYCNKGYLFPELSKVPRNFTEVEVEY